METSRRDFVGRGGAALGGLTLINTPFVRAFPSRAGEEVVPWLDRPPENPRPRRCAICSTGKGWFPG